VTTLSLNRLTQAQAAAMVAGVTGGKPIPQELQDEIVARTDGIPLFVEELTKAVLESGLLVEDGEAYVLAGKLTPLAIPETLQDSLLARLDRLSPVKEVAQMAAAIGREFGYELLAAVAPMGEAELRKALDGLIASGLVLARGLAPATTYAFKHALVQEIAYETALRSTRLLLHARIAAALVGKFPETASQRPELVAHHYARAGMTTDAVRFYYRAGQLAASRSANVEAANHLRRGLDLVETLPDSEERSGLELELQVALGARLIALKGFAAEETVAAYRRAQELSRRTGRTGIVFPALYGEWLYFTARGEHRKAAAIARRFVGLAEREGEEAPRVMAHRVAGVTHLCLGEHAPSRTHLEAVLALYEPQRHGELALAYGTDPAVSSAAFLSWVLWLQGDERAALAMRARGIARARELQHSHSLAHALCLGGCLLDCMRGDVAGARAAAETVVEMARAHRFPYWHAAGTAARGWCLARDGRPDAAVPVLHEAIALADEAVMEEFRPFVLAMLAEAHALAGRPGDGLAALADALARVAKSEERWIEPELYRLQGDLLRASGDDAAAETALVTAITRADAQGARAWQLRAALRLARLWQEDGRKGGIEDLLAPLCATFAPGSDGAELHAARAMLGALGAPRLRATA
jgi:predicted ATPase